MYSFQRNEMNPIGPLIQLKKWNFTSQGLSLPQLKSSSHPARSKHYLEICVKHPCFLYSFIIYVAVSKRCGTSLSSSQECRRIPVDPHHLIGQSRCWEISHVFPIPNPKKWTHKGLSSWTQLPLESLPGNPSQLDFLRLETVPSIPSLIRVLIEWLWNLIK